MIFLSPIDGKMWDGTGIGNGDVLNEKRPDRSVSIKIFNFAGLELQPPVGCVQNGTLRQSVYSMPGTGNFLQSVVISLAIAPGADPFDGKQLHGRKTDIAGTNLIIFILKMDLFKRIAGQQQFVIESKI